MLGELKGGAMKVGQALSVMEAAIPEEYGKPYREALTKLQTEAPPLPAAKVHRVLDAPARAPNGVTGSPSSDDTAVASASIGQVHKACGPTVVRSPSRFSTRAPTRRCGPT